MSSRRRVPGLALIVVVVALLVAVATVITGHHLSRLTAERKAATAAAGSVTTVADAIRSKLSAARVEVSIAGQGAGLASGAATGVSRATLAAARDSGEPVLDDTGKGVVVVARYNTAAAPTSVQARRDHLSGYGMVPLDLGATLSQLRPDPGGISVSGPNQEIVSVPTPGPTSQASVTVTLGPDLPPGWSMTEWTTAPSTPAMAWLVAFLLVLAGFATAVWLTIRSSESSRRRDELLGLQKTSSTVAELAKVAQHSLDLGDALPAVTTELASTLGLRGLSVATPTSLGERTIFVWGVPPTEDAPPRHEELRAGETLGLVLSRGSRVIAKLRVTAGRDLDHHEFRTLVAAGDVLASAVANAEAFSAQVELVRRMRSVDALKTVFLATASHELRTPVVAITGFASLLHSNWDSLTPAQARDYAERVDSIAQRLNRLVEDILDFSRLESGSGTGVESVMLDLASTVGNVLDEQPDLAADHELSYSPTPGLLVNGSRQAVDRVVTNLVGNAAKYSESGSPIRIFLRECDAHAELVVEDEGPGIPIEEREQVFSPFYRGPGDQVVRTRGAGLGLAIVSEFAASMGGRVRVGDAPGGGASFVVSYPLVVADASPNSGAADVQA